MQYLQVVNWSEFQHYKDRNPPWIKLHNQILENYEYTRLPDVTKAHLFGLWMLASRTENKIPNDLEWLAGKLGATEKVDLNALLVSGFIEFIDDSDSLEVSQNVSPGNWESRHITKSDKEAVLKRDGGKCQNPECGSTRDIEFDHIIPISQGGNSEINNVQLLCRPCNRKKRTKTIDYGATQSVSPCYAGIEGYVPLEEERRGETEAEAETEKSRRFAPPSLLEVQEYCLSRSSSVDAEKFIDYYAVNGWMRGKNKIKDWKACVRTWEKRDAENTPKAQTDKTINRMTDRSWAD